jgi:hypothetical protein
MRPVWLFIGSPDHLDTLEGAARILTDVAIPGVANLVATGTSEEGTPYLAVVDPGPALGSVVSSRKGLGEGEAIRIGLEVAGILSALAAAGVLLPDVGLERFARDGRDSVWLVDLIGARPSAPEEAQAAHLTLAREFCTTLLEDARRFLPTESLLNALADARSCASLVRSLAAAQLPLRR